MTPFRIEHEFRCAAPAQFWASYFDPDHRVRLDAATGIASRTVVEREDSDDTLLVVARIVPQREVPGFIRRLTGAGLDYVERQLFHKRDDRIDIDIQPAMFPSRTHIRFVYEERMIGPGRRLRSSSGEIDIRVPVVGGRVERSIRDDLQHSYQVAVPLTQEHLDSMG